MKINVLSKEISELIAAGEVIERPASVIKELVENSIDAGAEHITVEIKNGGSVFMRITDDGAGIAPEDVPTAFLRHATSKIIAKEDLDNIYTLGFRGEALASVAAVSRIEMLTKQRDNDYGVRFCIDNGGEQLAENTGCPDGTTIIVRDLFYNVPARLKFMKKDVTEGNAIISILQKIALSHPEISFKVIRDNKTEFTSVGDGELYSAIYAVYGKNFAHDMIKVDNIENGIRVHGYVIKPLYSKHNRSFQNFFVNGRYIKSLTCGLALEEAYKTLIMTGKFPACVLKLEIPPSIVDVNAHPAKIEVRFSDEKLIFNSIYFAVKNALLASGLIYEFEMKNKNSASAAENPLPNANVNANMNANANANNQTADLQSDSAGNDALKNADALKGNAINMQADAARNTAAGMPTDAAKNSPEDSLITNAQDNKILSENDKLSADNAGLDGILGADSLNQSPELKLSKGNTGKIALNSDLIVSVDDEDEALSSHASLDSECENSFKYISKESFQKKENLDAFEDASDAGESEQIQINVIGEAFLNYIIAQAGDNIVIIDKHAAHERIIYERLKNYAQGINSQYLMIPSRVLLPMNEYDAMLGNLDLLEAMGFKFDLSEKPYAQATAVPIYFEKLDIDEIIPEIAGKLYLNMVNPQSDVLDDMLHTLACKAAIKANDKNSTEELQSLAEQVFYDENIRHCPHGRPILFNISKRDLEKQFKRG